MKKTRVKYRVRSAAFGLGRRRRMAKGAKPLEPWRRKLRAHGEMQGKAFLARERWRAERRRKREALRLKTERLLKSSAAKWEAAA